jgi:hypothetical protein
MPAMRIRGNWQSYRVKKLVWFENPSFLNHARKYDSKISKLLTSD